MKNITSFFLASLLFTASIFQSGCFGQFELTKKVWEWNDDISDSRIVKTLVFWVLNIIPVYGIASFVDVLILNVIEFWSGSNPMSMKEGDIEIQYVTFKGNDYKMTATKNKLSVEPLNGENKGNLTSLIYTEESSLWSIETAENHLDIAKINKNEAGEEISVIFFNPNGNNLEVPYSSEGFALVTDYAKRNYDLALDEN